MIAHFDPIKPIFLGSPIRFWIVTLALNLILVIVAHVLVGLLGIQLGEAAARRLGTEGRLD